MRFLDLMEGKGACSKIMKLFTLWHPMHRLSRFSGPNIAKICVMVPVFIIQNFIKIEQVIQNLCQ